MIHLHDLNGCTPAPLASYLKALGILRTISTQADPSARAWWQGDRFRLASSLSRGELEDFFLKEYAPTPIFSPWLKGSGFYTANDPLLSSVENSAANRFEKLRKGHADASELLASLREADARMREVKERAKIKGLSAKERNAIRSSPEYKAAERSADKEFKQRKLELIPRLFREWRGELRQWLGAAMMLDENNDPVYPALLKSGGNDGRLDFSYTFLGKLSELFQLDSPDGKANPDAPAAIAAALWNEVGRSLRSGAIGQFSPAAAGGANSTAGATGDGSLNPMDYILMMEGTLLFQTSASRRFESNEGLRLSAPFAVRPQAAGYSSSAASDEGPRGEQWLPLWKQPATLNEIMHLLSEGRAQVGRQRARGAVDMARSIAQLGIARGVSAFQRFGFIKRNGESIFAVPLGLVPVPESARPLLRCLDDLDHWLPRLHKAAREDKVSASLKHAEHQIQTHLLTLMQHPDEPGRWQQILLDLADVEAAGIRAKWQSAAIPGLRANWLNAADDGSAEWRLAVCFAHQWVEKKGGIRRHWIATKKGANDCVMHGIDGLNDALSLLHRQLIESTQDGSRHHTVFPFKGTGARLADLAAFVSQELDNHRLFTLARALMAVRLKRDQPLSFAETPSYNSDRQPDPAWQILRLGFSPYQLNNGFHIPADAAVLRRLASGDAAGAFEIAQRRLRGLGEQTSLSMASTTPQAASLWAAALAFPIDFVTHQQLLKQLNSVNESRSNR